MPEAATTERPILVVDDDAAILEIVADVLEYEGYVVETALNGATAIEVVERTAPRLVLLDMRMPLLDGWGFARVLRERGIELPILVMTAARDAAGWADEIGAAGFLAKPFDIAELLGAVRGHVTQPESEPGPSSAQ
jgi:DNA-binding response OmpR family regulator